MRGVLEIKDFLGSFGIPGVFGCVCVMDLLLGDRVALI